MLCAKFGQDLLKTVAVFREQITDRFIIIYMICYTRDILGPSLGKPIPVS